MSQEQIQIKAIRSLSREIPLNDFGMPTGIYRTDLLPYHLYEDPGSSVPRLEAGEDIVIDQESEGALPLPPDTYRIAGFPAKELNQAFVPLQFDEGFPAFLNGLPFWGRLDFEPSDAFYAFQQYTQMNLGKESSDPEEDYDGREASGVRSLTELARTLYPDADILRMTDILQGYYHLFYWGLRAHAYDLFRVAQHQKQRELRAIESQDEHYVIARRLRHRLMQYMDSEEECWDLMTPKTALDMLKTVTGLERISAGLPAGGPAGAHEAGGQSFEVALRTVSQTHRQNDGGVITDEGEILDKALENPEAIEVLQELIIRTGGQ